MQLLLANLGPAWKSSAVSRLFRGPVLELDGWKAWERPPALGAVPLDIILGICQELFKWLHASDAHMAVSLTYSGTLWLSVPTITASDCICGMLGSDHLSRLNAPAGAARAAVLHTAERPPPGGTAGRCLPDVCATGEKLMPQLIFDVTPIYLPPTDTTSR